MTLEQSEKPCELPEAINELSAKYECDRKICRFAIRDNGCIEVYDLDFRKEVYLRYLEKNGLSEENVYDALTDWTVLREGLSDEDMETEYPSPLPEKYSGNIFDELKLIYQDLECIGIFTDPEIVFDDVVGRSLYYYDTDGEIYDLTRERVCDFLSRLGYTAETKENNGEKFYAVV